ncbi:MAG: RIP metalloprotease RseP [Flavobacteriaceae bacterium]|jgi:regulator of sigma E protease|nr:RIP metalloprotease RseP [Flavobacteriaceae bacterium]MBT4113647.1 RIP metalloprotease RseP [Flavobacteriaceae bacterium]MBT4614075.1 RIP metalloprotease RseP [Flavobacteriaceae bacterium]MBT5246496.1 RIP metalloprotease RseP [Flavobacteriaceae bacterium]MBT5650852.1 RIP metalloprotease RseP [Flavobacteriaceae bacterium]
MEILIKLSQFILSLSLIIVLHEFGHYIPAKLFKTRVEKFYLFFDIKFSLFKKKIGETVYGIGWLPLGGYIKIAGMIDESMDKEQMAKEPQPWEFRSKPGWQRLIIMLGGVVVNFILAFIIYVSLAFNYGDTTIPLNSIDGGVLITNPIFIESGFLTGDKIISVDGKEIETYTELRISVIGAKTYKVDRNGEIIDINLPVDFLGKMSSSGDGTGFELRAPFIIQSVSGTSLNKNYDLQQGDIITSINDKEIKYFDQSISILEENKNKTIEVELLRENATLSKTLNVDSNGKLGVAFGYTTKDLVDLGYMELSKNSYSFSQSLAVGSNTFISSMDFYLDQVKAIFNPNTGAYKGLGGFIAIGNIFPGTWDWQIFWRITAIISIMLGVLNLLPIPLLDGGHATFLIYEMVSGRKPSDKFVEYVSVFGLILLLTLVIYANGNDIYKLFNIISF